MPSTFLCQRCQTPSVVDQVWTSKEPYTELREGSYLQRHVAPDVPQWAREYAIQGLGEVCAYVCPNCGHTVAIAATDLG
ncbi:MAG: hypothetical protein ABIJ09_24260 [Pseudomonadota bacterium]